MRADQEFSARVKALMISVWKYNNDDMFSWMVVFSKKCGWLLQCHNSRPESTDFTLLSSLSFSSTATNRKRLEQIFGRGNSTLHTTLSGYIYTFHSSICLLYISNFSSKPGRVHHSIAWALNLAAQRKLEIGSSYNNQTETIVNKIYVKYPSCA